MPAFPKFGSTSLPTAHSNTNERTPLRGSNANTKQSFWSRAAPGYYPGAPMDDDRSGSSNEHNGAPPYSEYPGYQQNTSNTYRGEGQYFSSAGSSPGPVDPGRDDGPKGIQTSKGFRGRLRSLLPFIFVALLAWFAKDMLGMYTLSPAATEGRKAAWDRSYAKHQDVVGKMTEVELAWKAARDQFMQDQAQWQQERRQWMIESAEREKISLEERKIALEKERREQERRKNEEDGIRWSDLLSNACVSYGVRKYTAMLEGVPNSYTKSQKTYLCKNTKAWVSGMWKSPDDCNDRGAWAGGIQGVWIVEQEASCRTYFENLRDRGCTLPGSGKRRIESDLRNIERNVGDASVLCSSTPADFHGLHFDGPHACINSGRVGRWEIEDETCR